MTDATVQRDNLSIATPMPDHKLEPPFQTFVAQWGGFVIGLTCSSGILLLDESGELTPWEHGESFDLVARFAAVSSALDEADQLGMTAYEIAENSAARILVSIDE